MRRYTWSMLLAQSTYWLTEVAGRALTATLGSGWMRFRRAISAACAAATALRRRSTRMPGRPLRARSWLIRATSRSWSPACTGAAAGRLAASWALLRGRMRPGPAVTSNSRLMTSRTAMTSAIRPLPRRPAAWEASRAYAGASPRRRERDGASSSALLLVVCPPQSWVSRCSAPGSPWNASALRPWPGCAPQPWLGDWSALHSGVPGGSPPRDWLGTCPVLQGWAVGSPPCWPRACPASQCRVVGCPPRGRPVGWSVLQGAAPDGSSPRARAEEGSVSQSWPDDGSYARGRPLEVSVPHERVPGGSPPRAWPGVGSALQGRVPAGSSARGGPGTWPVLHGWLAGSSPRGGPEAGWTPQGRLCARSVPREGPGACRVSQGSLRKGSWP